MNRCDWISGNRRVYIDEGNFPEEKTVLQYQSKADLPNTSSGFFCHYEFHLRNVGYLLDNYFFQLRDISDVYQVSF
jgi:hypothetical protein